MNAIKTPEPAVCDRRTGQPITLPGPSGSPQAALRLPLSGRYLGHRVPADLRWADLRGLDLQGADVTGADLSDADLTGARLDGLRFDGRTRWPAGFEPERLGAVRVPLDLGGARCDGADFTGQSLRGANANGAQLRGARLDGADLTAATLAGAQCSGASLRGACLRDANLTAADFDGADLTDADLTGATWTAQTRWPEGFSPGAGNDPEALAALFKALSDPSRLAILGQLLAAEATGEELAARLELSEPTVSHHLARLREQGLAAVRPDGARKVHRALADALRAPLRDLPERLAAQAGGRGAADAFAQKVRESFFAPDGRLKEIPARQKKQRIVLERLVAEFSPGVRYPEKEINATLKRFHEDVATLRRLFIAERLMAREGGVYWRL